MRKLLMICGALLMTVCFASTAFAGAGGTVKSVNHKGYNTVAPENTLPAFELSAKMGYEYVETDISFTKDGVPVLLHNPNINNMARNEDGSELTQSDVRIDSLTYEETLKYDFTKGMSAYKRTKIARLDDFLDLCKAKGLHPYLELKENGDYTQAQINGLVDLVKAKDMEGKVSWISFSPNYLQWVKAKDKKARLGFLVIVAGEKEMKEAIATAKKLRSGSNDVFLDLANKTPYVTYDYELCKKAKIPVEIWLNDELNKFMGLTEKGILEKLDPYVTGVTVDQHRYAIPSMIALSSRRYTYNGKVRKPEVTVRYGDQTLVEGRDYKVTCAKGRKNAGKYKVKVRMTELIVGNDIAATFVIRKAANPLSVKGGKVKISCSALQKKSKSLAVSGLITVGTPGKGTVSYTKAGGNKKITIDKKTGKVTVKKGLKKGTYKLKLKIRAAGNRNYAAVTRTATVRIAVK